MSHSAGWSRTLLSTSGWASGSWVFIPLACKGEVYESHPSGDGSRPTPPDFTDDMKKFPHGGMLCLLGPYGDFFIDVLAEILTRFPDVDAFSFDGLHYGGVCYCQYCRENYRQATRTQKSLTPILTIQASAATSTGPTVAWKT